MRRLSLARGVASLVLCAGLALSHAINITAANNLSPRAGIAGGVPLRVLPLGDSITDGYASSDGNGYRLQLWNNIDNPKDFVGTLNKGNMPDGNNEGYNGATISEISSRIGRALEMRPNVVLVHVGTNDMNKPSEPDTAHERLGSLIDKIVSACPDAAVLVAKIVRASNGGTQARINSFNGKIPAVVAARAEKGKKVMVVDMSSINQLADGLHPNDAGYRQMGDIWYSAIQDAADKGWIDKPVAVDLGKGDSCPNRPVWYPQGQIASGIGSSAKFSPVWYPKGEIASGIGAGTGVRFGDIDGDGRDDYLWVSKAGAVKAYLNTPGASEDEVIWMPQGEIASGIGKDGDGVQFADMNGDGRDDYLWVSKEGAVICYLNKPGKERGKPSWHPIGETARGEIASGVGASRDRILFGDIDGDGRDDYLVVGDGGQLEAWLNIGSGDKPSWRPVGQVASGINAGDGAGVRVADINNDGRVDYLWVAENGSVTLYTNTADAHSQLPSWWAHGEIASGVGASRDSIAFADINGDGRSDYLVIGKNGQVKQWQNGGQGGKSLIGPGVQFHDIDGDGRDDYLAVDAQGRVTAYLNGGVSNGKQIWYPQGEIASGVGATRDQVHFADLDGDGDVEYLVVHANGAVDCWLNNGPISSSDRPGRRIWVPLGEIASGDGRADYLYVGSNSAVIAYINGGGLTQKQIWYPAGTVATGVGAQGKDIHFADINGDGFAEYLWVHPNDGSVDCWYNAGNTGEWHAWNTIATGVGTDGSRVRFGDLNGDGRADYLAVTSDNSGAVSEWRNLCQVTTEPPILIGGDWCERGAPADVDKWDEESTNDYLTRWWEHNGDTTNYAVDFGSEWGLGQTFRCSLPDYCEAPKCSELEPSDDDDTMSAFMILESISNFNRYLVKLREALHLSNTQYATLQVAIQQDFDPGKSPRDISGMESLSALSAIVGMLGGAMGSGRSGTNDGGIFASALALKEMIQGATRSISATLAASDISLSNIAEEAEYVHSFFGVNLHQLEDLSLDLFGRGKHKSDAEGSEEVHIKDLLSDGAWVDYRKIPSLNTDQLYPTLTQSELSDWLFKVVLGNLVNWVWKKQGVWISAIPMTEEECKENSPGNGDHRLKLCKDGKAYFLQRLTKKDQGISVTYTAALPEFWGEMEKKYGITPQDAIESSVEAYKSGGLEFKADSLLGNILDISGTQNIQAGVQFPGIFSLPVCDLADFYGDMAKDNDWNLKTWMNKIDTPGDKVWEGAVGICWCASSTGLTDFKGNLFKDYAVHAPSC
ncbi:hypothetical protein BJY04DRAFT_213590 [Aspergillus karnatakaensis]|uniref:uncharacterized protein n=1 Tax=Aspergillus karnatakaensis TaxID=1810916 RepID=UPI003CCD31B1